MKLYFTENELIQKIKETQNSKVRYEVVRQKVFEPITKARGMLTLISKV